MKTFFSDVHPKFIEATGIALVLAAALWSYYTKEALDTKLQRNEAKLLNLRLVGIEQMIAADHALRKEFLFEDRDNFDAAYKAIDDLRNDGTYKMLSWLKLSMYSCGTILLIAAKIKEGLKR
ncbi:MAG: hypothetical protein ACRYGP_17425 [Janthinobacterium lividum]